MSEHADPKLLLAGGVGAVLLVAYLLSRGSGPTFVSGGGPDAASYKAAADLNTQQLNAAVADKSATLASLRDVYGLDTTLQSHTLDLQASAVSERARLNSALAMQQSAAQGALALGAQQSATQVQLANIQAAQQDKTTQAQAQVAQAQQDGQNTNGFLDFLLGAAKVILPFLF